MATLITRALEGKKIPVIPFWFMRQAGRYLPEYKKLREKAGDFLTLCYTPDMAAEVTLQPVRRFDMDAAIIFSDILVVPHAMGVEVKYVQGEGPVLTPVKSEAGVLRLKKDMRKPLAPVAKAIALVRARLPEDKSLIGFCGAPWTVACYMIEGKNKGEDWQEARRMALKQKDLFSSLIERLVSASVEYLCMQAEAGADVLQIFDSWAGVLTESEYEAWVIAPTRRLVEGVRKHHPQVPIMGFPRGSGPLYAEYAEKTKVNGVSLDSQVPLAWAAKNLTVTLQGNLDPFLLAEDKHAAVGETKRILKEMRKRPFIFNLGHGIVPNTPLQNVMAVCETIRAFKA